MSRPDTIAVLASRLRADDKRLLDALEHRGVPVVQVDPRRLAFALEATEPPWRYVLNREISASRARHAALSLEATGAVVVNSAAALETCADKWLTSLALHRDGVTTPRSVLALTPEGALDAIEALGYPVVIKPLTSSWGKRVALIRDPDTARAITEHCAALPAPTAHLIYVQKYVDKPDRDIRVVVAGGRPIAAAYRVSDNWRTNVALGAKSEPCEVTPELAKLAVAAARAVGTDVAGVDIVEDREQGLSVLEVNHNVEFSGVQRAHRDLDIAAEIVDAILTQVPA